MTNKKNFLTYIFFSFYFIILNRIKVFSKFVFAEKNSNEYSPSLKYYKFQLKSVGFPVFSDREKIEEEQLISSLSHIRHIINITLGTQKTTLPCDLSFDFYSLYISENKTENCGNNDFNNNNYLTYFPKESKTYENLTDIISLIKYQYCYECLFAKDTFFIENDNFNDLNFVLGKSVKAIYKNISSGIGLRPQKTPTDLFEDNFLVQLKHKDAIDEQSFRIRFNSKNNKKSDTKYGELIIGSYPHEYLDKVYNEKKFLSFYTGSVSTSSNTWDFSSKKIFYGNMSLPVLTSISINFKLDTVFIRGDYSLFPMIKKDFIKGKNKNENLCEIYTYPTTGFRYFICDKNIDKSIVKDLVFFPKNSFDKINITFNSNDLFYDFFDKEGNHKLLFLISFHPSYFSWEIGNIFIYKYQPVFDLDKKTIGFYEKLYPEEEDKHLKKCKNGNMNKKINIKQNRNFNFRVENVLEILAVVILGMFLLFLMYFFYYVKKNKNFFFTRRKKRINEIEFQEFVNYDNKNKDKDNNNNNKNICNEKDYDYENKEKDYKNDNESENLSSISTKEKLID